MGVNHLEGHVYSNWISTGEESGEPAFPLVCLIVSGGNSDIVLMEGHGAYRRLGTTRDDAAGEAFDKVARILGVGYPGGPAIQQAAQGGNPMAFPFPGPGLERATTSASAASRRRCLRTVQGLEKPMPIPDLAAGFQEAVVDVLSAKVARAAREYGAVYVAVCGGVSANLALRERVMERVPVPVRIPPIHLCTDNAAMIASAGYYRFVAGHRSGLDLDVSPNLPLT